MDQQKTGSFLKELRTEKGLTQAELAERLNTTDRSVSRWETGRTMPDISVLIELADFYRVDIKEILDGERQSEKTNGDVKATAEKVAEYSKKAGKRKVTKTVALMLIPIVVLTALLVIVFSSRSVPVSPDGYPPYQQVTIDPKITDELINDHVIAHMPEPSGNSRDFSGIKVFSSEEKQSGDYYVYAWAVEAVYSYKGGVLTEESGSSYPCRFELMKENDGFSVVGADVPRDGSFYVEDIKKLFPGYVVKMIETVQEDGTVEKLSDGILADAKSYFNVG
ncbi:MAG: helix-turn-helix domain-containing protein [Clostridia bacterium]|nr:helix-turn-helix domain-containing protein [Clostridia bacterium]